MTISVYVLACYSVDQLSSHRLFGFRKKKRNKLQGRDMQRYWYSYLELGQSCRQELMDRASLQQQPYLVFSLVFSITITFDQF